jgi:hypothetical protein
MSKKSDKIYVIALRLHLVQVIISEMFLESGELKMKMVVIDDRPTCAAAPLEHSAETTYSTFPICNPALPYF